MSETEEYYDAEGEPISLEALCRTEPEWAASRIRHSRTALAAAHEQIAALTAERDRWAGLQNLPNEVPTTWLDPLLTGPDKVLPDDLSRLTPRHIEALLRGIQDRQRAAVTALRTADEGEGE